MSALHEVILSQEPSLVHSIDTPIGLTLCELVRWAKKLEDKYGAEMVIKSLDSNKIGLDKKCIDVG
tara:strand:+ start:584 stop:781 length:198 start_codon:yes stop_codon:yes gene_type:complete